MTTIEAAPKTVIVKKEEVEEKMTKSGLLLHSKVAEELEKLITGEICYLGIESGKAGYNIGDKVIFSKYCPTEFEHESEKLLVLNYEDIVGRIKEV